VSDLEFILADKVFNHLDGVAGVTNLLALYVRCKGFLTNATTRKETYVDGYAKLNEIEIKQYWQSYDEDADLYKPEFLFCHGAVAGKDINAISVEDRFFFKERSVLIDKSNVFVKKDELDAFNKKHGIHTELEKSQLGTDGETKTNNYSERHAANREQILGAALSVLAQYPNECKNKKGKIVAAKICTLIDEKAPLFWESTGEPPLSVNVMTRHISEWIKKTAD